MGRNNKLINSLNEIARRNRLNNIYDAGDTITPHIYAGIAIALHEEGWGYKRITRVFARSQQLWDDIGGDNMVELCERETGITLKGDKDDK